MAFHWRADDGPSITVFGSSIPSSIKKIGVSNLDAQMLFVNYNERGRTMIEMCADHLKQLREIIQQTRRGKLTSNVR